MTRERFSPFGIAAGLLVLAVSLMMLANTPAKADEPVCHAAMVLDRSGSVDISDLDTMQAQIRLLFQVGGIHDPNVELAFWSFSSAFNPAQNYDAPFSDFVSSVGTNSAFENKLAQIVVGGNTNYEQGFGYDGFATGGQTLNTHDNIDAVINKADIIVLMTDGVPNAPGPLIDNNPTARDAGRAAVLRHKAAGKLVAGGIMQGLNQSSLNYVINGNSGDGKDVFTFSTDYTTLSAELKTKILEKCGEIDTPPTSLAYSLVPKVSSANTVVSGTGGASFTYNVNNDATDGLTNMTNWTIRRVLVDRGQDVTPLYFGSEAYRDGYTCAQMVTLISGNGSCSDISNGQRRFGPGDTSLDSDAGFGATDVVVDDSWAIGSKVCFVLTLDRPTQDPNTPRDRYSRAACLVVGKRPQVQIYGGDLKVGRHFVSDSILLPDPSVVKASLSSKSDGFTYGSWAEYAVAAPGSVVGFASLSGLEGGLETTFAMTQSNWSKLTFANTSNQYGKFTANNSGMGTIPDAKSAILASYTTVTRDLTGVPNFNLSGASTAEGMYRKDTGNLSLDASTIERGKTFIVYVPAGTLTITGNIDYVDGPYTDVSQIPQLVIIAKKITIQPAVTHVGAWLIADDETDGTVVTCDDPATLTITVCNQQLRIDGPVMTRHLSLRRTYGAESGWAAGVPAEIINLPASAYLWSLSAGHSDSRAQTTFVTELPPYF